VTSEAYRSSSRPTKRRRIPTPPARALTVSLPVASAPQRNLNTFHRSLQLSHLNRLLVLQRTLIPLHHRRDFLLSLVNITEKQEPARGKGFFEGVGRIRDEMREIERQVKSVDQARRSVEERVEKVEKEIDRLEREVEVDKARQREETSSQGSCSRDDGNGNEDEDDDDGDSDCECECEEDAAADPPAPTPTSSALLSRHQALLPLLLAHLSRLSRLASILWSRRSTLQSRWTLLETVKTGGPTERDQVRTELGHVRGVVGKAEEELEEELLMLVVLRGQGDV
jgi:hypothetical protein